MNRRNPEHTRKLLLNAVPAAFVMLVLVFLALANVPAKRPSQGDSAQPASSQRVEQPVASVDGGPSDYHEQEQDAARKDVQELPYACSPSSFRRRLFQRGSSLCI